MNDVRPDRPDSGTRPELQQVLRDSRLPALIWVILIYGSALLYDFLFSSSRLDGSITDIGGETEFQALRDELLVKLGALPLLIM
ncbi:hypothetical protein NSS64_12285 [Paenibacillus sp. FSL H8-0122]|uniref:hypothetical protein n=1 Tax=Paenibacillus sp. FSL H8-0122 TaxID=2954510 RepID=UPI0030F83F04